MRVAFINTYGNGSTGKIIDSLKDALIKSGNEVRSYFSREYCATPKTSKRFYSKLGFYFDALMTRLFDNHGLNSKENTKKLLSDLDSYNPDIIHIHNLHGYWINYEMLFSYIKNKGLKVVFTLHDCWSFTGHCTHFDYIGCNKWEAGCYKCPQKKIYPKSFLLDGSKRNFLRKKEAFTSLDDKQMIIVTPSEWLKEKVEQSFLNKYECKVINNGVNTSVFKPTQSNIRDKYGLNDKVIVLAVANYWDEKKGLDFVIECAKVKPNWCFIFIGQEKKKVINYPSNVIHIERTESQQDLAAWYSTANVYFNPTLEDTYPTTNLEAIACGTPVVTFNTGGSPESIEKYAFGIVVDRDNDSIIKGINAILNHYHAPDVDRNTIDSDYASKEYIDLYKTLEIA